MPIAVTAAVLAAAAGLAAAPTCVGGAAPDGRIGATVCLTGEANGGEADVSVQFGAYDAVTGVGATPDGLFLTNVPFLARRVLLGPAGPEVAHPVLARPAP